MFSKHLQERLLWSKVRLKHELYTNLIRPLMVVWYKILGNIVNKKQQNQE